MLTHKTLSITPTETDQDQGTFVAIVSAWEADREGDVIERHAFDKTITAWQQSGKQLPLLVSHSTTEVGSIDPWTMIPTDEGLQVAGEIDRDTPEGKQAWKQIKRGTAGFSIGFMSKSSPRNGGGRTITEVDLFEVSITPTPMNAATRATSWKSAPDTNTELDKGLRGEWDRLKPLLDGTPTPRPAKPAGIEAKSLPEQQQALKGVYELAGGEPEVVKKPAKPATTTPVAIEREAELVIDPSGAIVDLTEQRIEATRAAEREKSQRAEREAKGAERRVEAEALAAAERADREADQEGWRRTYPGLAR